MLVPEGRDEGADGELQYAYVAQDLDQSPDGPKANDTNEGKSRIISPVFENYAIYPYYDCAFMFQKLN
jgi:hypothetical protein